MENIIVADGRSNLYEFDGTKMKSLGTPKKFKDVWKGRIFQIGYNYYFKDKDTYHLLGDEGQTYVLRSFGNEDPFVNKQLFKFGEHYLLVEPDTPGFVELTYLYGPLLASIKSFDFKDRAFVLIGGKKFEIYILDENEKPKKLTELFYNSPEDGAFEYKNAAFVLENGVYVRKPWRLFGPYNDDYGLFAAGKAVFKLLSYGTFEFLGTSYDRKAKLHDTKIGTKILFLSGSGTYWHLGENFVEQILSVDCDAEVSIDCDGNIRYYHRSIEDYGEVVTSFVMLLDENTGKYYRKD